jgi:hypothetical protein
MLVDMEGLALVLRPERVSKSRKTKIGNDRFETDNSGTGMK